MTTISPSLEVIDFTPFLANEGCVVGKTPTAAQINVAKQIDRTMCDVGFLYVENLGLTEDELAFTFMASKDLFASKHLAPFVAEKNIGYCKLGKESVNHARGADLQESFSVRSRRCYSNDYGGAPPGFETTIHDFWDKLEEASRRFAVALALAMGLPKDELDLFSRSIETMEICTLKLQHYPPCDFESGVTDGANSNGSVRIGEHTDFGLFTFLFLEGDAPGLQVKKASEGDDAVSGISGCASSDWIDAPGMGGNIAVVNSGALLARWTNDRWRATAHRVIVPCAEDAAKHRYSMPFFVLQSPETLVAAHPRFVQEGEEAHHAPITAGEYLRMKLHALHDVRAVQSKI